MSPPKHRWVRFLTTVSTATPVTTADRSRQKSLAKHIGSPFFQEWHAPCFDWLHSRGSRTRAHSLALPTSHEYLLLAHQPTRSFPTFPRSPAGVPDRHGIACVM